METLYSASLKSWNPGAGRVDLKEAHISYSLNNVDVRIGSITRVLGKTENL